MCSLLLVVHGNEKFGLYFDDRHDDHLLNPMFRFKALIFLLFLGSSEQESAYFSQGKEYESLVFIP